MEVNFMDEAARVAKESTCMRSRCGSVIVSQAGEILGTGFNSPPKHLEGQRRCVYGKRLYNLKVTDKTCCVHAEERAIIDAVSKNSDKVVDSTLYFVRIDESGNKLISGKPFCTICSKLALDVGISFFVLLHEDGEKPYDTETYNKLSFEYN